MRKLTNPNPIRSRPALPTAKSSAAWAARTPSLPKGGKLFHYLIRCLQDEDDAADLAQETFVRVYRQRAKFDLGQKFSTWLYAIATNLVKDRYRYRTRHPQVPLDAEKHAAREAFGKN